MGDSYGLGVRLRVLGPVEVESPTGEVAVVGPSREQIVLTALALAAPDAISTGRLIDVLWGEEPPPSAAGTLKSLVHRIRRRHGTGLVETIPGGYRLGPVTSDVAMVRAEVEAGRHPPTAGDAASAVERLKAAVNQFRGPPAPALESTVPGAVLMREIEVLRQRVAEALVDARLAAGAGGEILGELEAAVAEDPLSEATWGRLMVALTQAGRQAAALGAYQRARKALIEGAGIEPGPALREIERKIIDQDPDLVARPTAGTSAEPERIPGPGLRSDLSWVAVGSLLVGREAEMAAVTDAIAASRTHSDRRLILLSGDAGMGKTRLASDVASNVAADGAIALYGRCEEGSPAPYRPFSTAIGRFVDLNVPEVIEPLLGPHPDLVARIVPSIRDSFDVPPAAAIDPDGGLRSFDAVSRLLDDLGNVVLVLDDLHWAAAPTVALLNHLVSSAGSGLTILATYRPRDLAVGHPLVAALPPLNRNPNTTSIELRRLTTGDIHLYVEHTAGQKVESLFVDDLATATGGVPYLLTSSLSYLTDSETAIRKSGRWELGPDAIRSLPSGVRHLVGEQIARLDSSTIGFLRSAAIVGSEFDVEVAADAAGMDLAAALDAVEAASMTGLVRELGYGHWQWSHDLARSVVLSDVSTTRRVQTHWRVAEAMGRQRRINYDDVAYHVTEGLLAAPAETAATKLRDAAEDALDRSPEAGLGYVETALDAIDGTSVGPLLRASLLTLRAITVFETADDPDSGEVEAAMVAAEEATLESGDPDLIVRAHTLEGRYPGTRQFFQFDQRRVAAGLAALDRLPADAGVQRAILLGHLAELYFFDWDAPGRHRVVEGLMQVLDTGALTPEAAASAERSLAVFSTVSPEGEALTLRDRQRNRALGSRHNTPAGPDSRDFVEGTEGKLDMRRLDAHLATGRFKELAVQIPDLPEGDQQALSDQITMMRVRCIVAGVHGDTDTLEAAIEWIDRGGVKATVPLLSPGAAPRTAQRPDPDHP